MQKICTYPTVPCRSPYIYLPFHALNFLRYFRQDNAENKVFLLTYYIYKKKIILISIIIKFVSQSVYNTPVSIVYLFIFVFYRLLIP